MKQKLIRTATIPLSLDVLLKGQLSFLNQYYNVIAISGEDEHLETVRTREKVKTIEVSFQRQISPIKDLVSLYKLYSVLRKEKPQIIHSITPKAGLLSMIAGYFAKVPVRIHTFTGLVFPSKTGLTRSILILMDKVLCLFATTIIPEGNGVKSDLIKYKITTKPLKIMANGNINGIDCDFFNPTLYSEENNSALKKELAISKVDFVFIFVGRIVTDKGINELIAAFHNLSLENENVKLLLVGNFEQELDPILPETLFKIETDKNIISVGYQNDVRPYFAIANALVFPSYREGFPNVVIQAGAMNLPCIVSNINGCNEIIIDNENGVIIPVKDDAAILNAMLSFISDVDKLKHLKQNARKLIVSRYEQNTVWNAILEEYRTFAPNH